MDPSLRVLGFGSGGEDAALVGALAASGVTLELTPSAEVGAAPATTGTLATALIDAESRLLAHPPDGVLLDGAGDEVLGACLAASKLELPIARMGAGTRSGEPLNARLIDRLAGLLLCSGEEELDALRGEGLARNASVATAADAAAARIAEWLARAREGAAEATAAE